MSKKYNESSENLNFKVGSVKLNFTDSEAALNFKLIYNKFIFNEAIYPCLNFVVKDYDGIYILYKVLIDFIENYAVGDIFSATILVDGVVDFMEGV